MVQSKDFRVRGDIPLEVREMFLAVINQLAIQLMGDDLGSPASSEAISLSQRERSSRIFANSSLVQVILAAMLDAKRIARR